jgi:hypothetical protein
MAGQKGYKGKVSIATTTILGVGSWTPSGSVIAMLDGTALTDEYDVKEYGRTNPGNIVVNGFYDPSDTTGQDLVRAAHSNKTNMDTLRFYFGTGANDYFESDGTAELLISEVSPPTVDKDDSGLAPFSFTVEISKGALIKNT